jgi:hypothetical protein
LRAQGIVVDFFPLAFVGVVIIGLFVAQAVRLWWRGNEWKRRLRNPRDRGRQ